MFVENGKSKKDFQIVALGLWPLDLRRRNKNLTQGLKASPTLNIAVGVADGRTGDGAGIMTEIPFDLLGVNEG